jgi:outer membrane protein TolC
MKVTFYWSAILVLGTGILATAQDMPMQPSTLASLIAEAEANNSQISAADHAWKAATHVGQQLAVLPDPQLTVQDFSVGSPKPFAGFSNSDFAYIGFGASQDLPYPGKLKLKSEVANRQADTSLAQADQLRASIAEQVKLAYVRLAYHEATLAILNKNEAILRPLIESGLSRYSVGQGSQADVLKAQLELTKLLREKTMHHQDMGQLQAVLKQLLHRPQQSVDIMPDKLTAMPLRYTASELAELVQSHDPAVHTETAEVQKQAAAVKSAEREGKPDFNVGYMFQQTGAGYRDYYVLTLNMRLPRRKRIESEVAEATEMLNGAKQTLDSQVQQELAEVQKQYVAATSAEKQITEFQQGLLPQVDAVFHSQETAYQSSKQQFEPVLLSLMDALAVQRDYEQVLLDHEMALVRLETLTGASIR